MNSWANLQGLIPILCGIYGLLMAHGRLPHRPDDAERMALWRRKFGGLLKVCGPVCILFGIAQLFGLI